MVRGLETWREILLKCGVNAGSDPRCHKEKRNMTKEEAYQQIAQSASLFKAVLEYVGYPKTP